MQEQFAHLVHSRNYFQERPVGVVIMCVQKFNISQGFLPQC